MVKPKTQVKAAVKAVKLETDISPVAAVNGAVSRVRMSAKKDASDMKKSTRGQAKDTTAKAPVNAVGETLEDNVTPAATATKSPGKAPAHVAEIAKAVMAVKEPGLLTAKI